VLVLSVWGAGGLLAAHTPQIIAHAAAKTVEQVQGAATFRL